MSLKQELQKIEPHDFEVALNAAVNQTIDGWRHKEADNSSPTELGPDPQDRTEIDRLKHVGALSVLDRFAAELESNSRLLPDVPAAQKEGIVLGLDMVAGALATYIFAQKDPGAV